MSEIRKCKLNELKDEQVLLLVANGGYASHYAFTPDEWLSAKKLVRETPNLIELNRKLIRIPTNISWERLS